MRLLCYALLAVTGLLICVVPKGTLQGLAGIGKLPICTEASGMVTGSFENIFVGNRAPCDDVPVVSNRHEGINLFQAEGGARPVDRIAVRNIGSYYRNAFFSYGRNLLGYLRGDDRRKTRVTFNYDILGKRSSRIENIETASRERFVSLNSRDIYTSYYPRTLFQSCNIKISFDRILRSIREAMELVNGGLRLRIDAVGAIRKSSCRIPLASGGFSNSSRSRRLDFGGFDQLVHLLTGGFHNLFLLIVDSGLDTSNSRRNQNQKDRYFFRYIGWRNSLLAFSVNAPDADKKARFIMVGGFVLWVSGLYLVWRSLLRERWITTVCCFFFAIAGIVIAIRH